MKIVYPNEFKEGKLYAYKRMHPRPDFPPQASVYLDVIPLPTPDVRPQVWLTEKLPDDVADRFDFKFLFDTYFVQV